MLPTCNNTHEKNKFQDDTKSEFRYDNTSNVQDKTHQITRLNKSNLQDDQNTMLQYNKMFKFQDGKHFQVSI